MPTKIRKSISILMFTLAISASDAFCSPKNSGLTLSKATKGKAAKVIPSTKKKVVKKPSKNTSKKSKKPKKRRKKRTKPRVAYPGHMIFTLWNGNTSFSDNQTDPSSGDTEQISVEGSTQKIATEWLPGTHYIFFLNYRNDAPTHEVWTSRTTMDVLFGYRLPFLLITTPILGLSQMKNTMNLESLESPVLAVTESLDLIIGFKGRYDYHLFDSYSLAIDFQYNGINMFVGEDSGTEMDVALILLTRFGGSQADLRFGITNRAYLTKDKVEESSETLTPEVNLNSITKSSYIGLSYWL